ncbi:MAG: hypothetical protein ACFB0D_17940 [Phormidesmis sp.]
MNSHLQKVWTPPFNTPSCTPEKDLSTVDFFVGPPREIGELTCVDGTPSKQKSGKSLFAGIAVLVALSVTITLISFSLAPSIYTLAISGGLCTLLSAALIYEDKVYCYFVGKIGVCESSARLCIPGKPQTKILLFNKAAALFVTKIHQHTNGIYAGTSYKYVWTLTDKTKFVVEGYYYGEKKKRGGKDKYCFAESAESAWTKHLLQIVDEQFEENEYVDFPMSEKPEKNKIQTIRMRKGNLEFFLKKGGSQVVDISDFKQASLHGGFITFKHKDAQWWSGNGSFSFNYALVPNAYLFLICLNRIAGF